MPTVHCNCCGRSKVDVSHMIAGPNVYLCDRCVAQVAWQLAAGRPAPDALRCRFCHQLRATADVTTVGRVTVCVDCLGTMTSILAETTPPSRTATSDR